MTGDGMGRLWEQGEGAMIRILAENSATDLGRDWLEGSRSIHCSQSLVQAGTVA